MGAVEPILSVAETAVMTTDFTAWLEVHDLSLRYAEGIDRRDWDAYRSCFTDEVVIDFSSFTHVPAPPAPMGADDWVAAVRGTISGFEATQHLIANQRISFDDADHARYTAYIQAQHWMDREHFYLVGGWYENRAVRHGGIWRLTQVILHQEWDTGDRGLLREASRRAAGGGGPTGG